MTDANFGNSFYDLIGMEKRRVLLICLQPLLSEGLQRIFQSLEDVDLIPLPCKDQQAVDSILDLEEPDAIVIAGEREDSLINYLISTLLGRWTEVPIIQIGLEDSDLHIYSSQTLPGNRAGLTELIRQLTTAPKRLKKNSP